MTYNYGKRSTRNLNSCHKNLILLFLAVIEEIDCSVICGNRSRQEQEKAFCSGASLLHFPNSKHNTFPSRAVDVLPYPFNHDWNRKQFEALGEVVQRKAKELGINVKWGKYFADLVDCPHWEI